MLTNVYQRDRPLRHAEEVGDFSLWESALVAQSFDVVRLFLCQLRHRMFAPAQSEASRWRRMVRRAAFQSAVGIIVCNCANAKMHRITAGWRVAGVHDDESGWWRSVRQVIRHAMRNQMALLSGFWISPCRVAISTLAPWACPRPTLGWIATINAIPKTRSELKEVPLWHLLSISLGAHCE